jgi:DNA topoisomerase-1
VFTGWRDGSVHDAGETARGERQWEAATLLFLKRARRATGGRPH